jgi:5-methylcytosine-specific restriction endonuclease McrA
MPEILHRWDQQQKIAVIARGLSCGENTVRRVIDQERPGERLGRLQPLQEKCCTGCQERMPLSAFPPRGDREGKVAARCFTCLLDWRRAYQKANPERNREGVRRRRARLRNARTETYRDSDIYQRDEGLCFFCGDHVDPTLIYPDPWSMVVHHVHPIAKHGPDIVKNVALGHYTCNQREKDRYLSPLTDWVVSAIPYATARDAVIEHHYLHRPSPTSYAFGLFDQEGLLRGVATFGTATSRRVVTSITDDPQALVLSFNRLWVDDSAPFGSGSYFVSRALKQLPPAIVVAYADTEVVDPRYQTPHSGGVYRACSFFYAGTSWPNSEWRMPGKARNVGKAQEGSVKVRVSPKSRYWTTTGSARQKKSLRTRCKWASMPYTSQASLPLEMRARGE